MVPFPETTAVTVKNAGWNVAVTVFAYVSATLHWSPEEEVQPSHDLRIVSSPGVAVSVTGSFATIIELHPSV
jgi:hypothetical protein